MVTVTIAAGAHFDSQGQRYSAGETVSVSGFDAERGRYYGVFVAA